MYKYDVVIVGARVAGASTALLLARAGLSVLVLDRAAPGTDTLSTHAFMRAGVIQLARWGVLPAVLERAPAVRETVFGYDGQLITVPMGERHGVDGLVAPRRHTLDALLVQAAREAGAEFRFRHRVLDVQPGKGVRARGPEGECFVRADFVVGADGLRSQVAKAVDATVVRRTEASTGSVYAYVPSAPEDSGYVWRFKPGSAAFVVPTEQATLLCATVSSRRFLAEVAADPRAALRRVLTEHDPALAARLPENADIRGFAGAPGCLRRAWGPGWALVGDAGYFRDPITAHGMTDALRDAELLARALITGGNDALAHYQGTRDAFAQPFLDVTDRLATFEWSMSELEQLHRSAAREMRREADLVARFGPLVTGARMRAVG
ncbi:MAG: NAD(P)/FAD-dependent oxidoreductase [Deltaproteobacteria bacterium]|nr:MAG: NAD(P)/FAD-dependent oxidoreductase [Deltaproteobacteria bacterium]